jgi:glyceraldehyde 3-phosphate dehydrogenase
MAISVGINNCRRLGRIVFRAIVNSGKFGSEIDVAAVNDLLPRDNQAYLAKHDSIQERFHGEVHADGHDTLVGNGNRIKCLAIKDDPRAFPWKDIAVDIVVESTWLFTEDENAEGHLKACAKNVLISAPGKGDRLKAVVIGVNDRTLSADDNTVSNAACTTNCLAPITKTALDSFGIVEGLMITVPSYTETQRTVDARR